MFIVYQLSGLFKITNAAITPGTHPQSVSKKTITKEPHPFPNTDNGGKKMANKTLNKLIVFWLINSTYETILIKKCYKKRSANK